jgi:hypothetical protein
VRQFDAYLTEAAESDDRDSLAGPGVPMLERRIERDSGARTRRGWQRPNFTSAERRNERDFQKWPGAEPPEMIRAHVK